MSTYSNGFLAYHIEVQVNTGSVEKVRSKVKQWQTECRLNAGWPDFPASLVARIESIQDVQSVICEGPQSSALIPLRMMRSLTRSRCQMSTTMGTGPIAQTIRRDFETWGIGIASGRTLADADSPIEFSFRERSGRSASLILYPSSRRHYQASMQPETGIPDNLILNRYNQGLSRLATNVCAGGGKVSFRPRELGRYDNIEDWISLLPHTHQLAISCRHRVMKSFATHEGITTARGWPDRETSVANNVFIELASALSQRMPPGAIVLLHRQAVGDTLFYDTCQQPVVIKAPEGYGNESRMARLQGALFALTTLKDQSDTVTSNAESWQQLCTDSVNYAWQGTDTRPWRYPNGQST